MSKKVIYGQEARGGLKKGLDTVADAVKVTMGAKGLPVAIDRPYTTPLVTKDGVTVAKEIHLEDPLLNMGANMIIEAASKTNDLAGDGTSTSTVLTQAIVEEGMKSKSSFYELKKGMEFASEKIIEKLKENSISIKEDKEKIIAIPTISANNDREIGELIADTFNKVGEHGFISVEESKTSKTTVEISKGLKFKMYPESDYFYNDTLKKYSEISDSKVLLYIGRIQTEDEILPALSLATEHGKHILVVCQEIDPMLLTRIITTRLKGQVKVTVVQCPEFGVYRQEAMEDIALVAGAKLFLQEREDDIRKVTLEDLGNLEKLIIDEEHTCFINSATKEKVEEKTELLLQNLEGTQDPLDVKDIKERIARLKGGVARIHVGATSEMEMKEKKDRIEDAVNALTVAYKDGVVIGGGIALLNASKDLIIPENKPSSFQTGVEVVINAVTYPFHQILKNAGIEEEKRKEIQNRVVNTPNLGYDVVKEQYTDMVVSGILDPLGVTVSALKNAVSVAGVFLSTDCVLLDVTNYATKEIKFEDGI